MLLFFFVVFFIFFQKRKFVQKWYFFKFTIRFICVTWSHFIIVFLATWIAQPMQWVFYKKKLAQSKTQILFKKWPNFIHFSNLLSKKAHENTKYIVYYFYHSYFSKRYSQLLLTKQKIIRMRKRKRAKKKPRRLTHHNNIHEYLTLASHTIYFVYGEEHFGKKLTPT